MRPPIVAAAGAKRGFGAAPKPAAKPAPPVPDGSGGDKKKKVRRRNLAPPGPVPPPPPTPSVARPAPALGGGADRAADAVAALEDKEFNDRLAALAARAARATAAKERAEAATTILDGVPDYSRPAPTLGGALRGETSAREEAADPVGGVSFTKGAGAAITAVALAAVFLFTSGGGGGGGGTVRPRAVPQLTEAQRADAAARLVAARATLETAPDDVAALRGAAAAAAALGEPAGDVTGFLERAASVAPTDVSVWRELGTAKLAAGDAPGAIAAYERARAESPDPARPPFTLAADLARARVAAGDAAAAVKEVAAARAAAAAAGDADAAYELGLLQGKLLSEWPRHAADADALYEKLTADAPDDFRGWLARGALARGNGRAGDAARYFLQARYLAKAGQERAAVDAVAG